MTNLTDFTTLQEAQAYSVPRTRLLSTDMLTSIMVGCGVLNLFLDSANEIARGTCIAMQASAEFNFIQGNSIGDGHLEKLQEFIDSYEADPATKTKLEIFRDQVVGYCNTPTTPYASATQEDWDKAQASISPTKVESTYISDTWIVRAYGEKISTEVTVTEALPYDDVITFTVQSKNLSDVFAENDQVRGTLKIPAGFVGVRGSLPLNLTGVKRHVKVFAESKFNRDFTAFSEKTE